MAARHRLVETVARVVMIAVALATTAAAQRGGRFPGGGNFFGGALGCPNPPFKNVPYDGKFTFARIIYTGGPGNCYYRGEPSWAHGFGYTERTAEGNLMKITAEVSALKGHVDGTNAVAIDDPMLFKYPVAFLVEAGYLQLSDTEAKILHDYVEKGGFIIVDDSRDDFRRGQSGWGNIEAQFGRIFPGLHPMDIPVTHPIFHSFFDIKSFDIVKQFYDQGPPVFRAIFENNDPKKRLLVMINFNTDVSNYWEFSAQGWRPVDESNEAYKLGVNYLFYALTH
jgi:hypothetical protein